VVGEPVVLLKNTVFSGGTTLEDNGEPYSTENLLLGAPEPLTVMADGTAIGTKLSE
jgi:poly(beta-D-mannuronate) lyase